TYGEWVSLPSGRFGWSPYSRAGWAPYTHGHWEWYPGFGWTWISGDPWGWLTDHCGQWDFDSSFGWYWMNPMFGCGFWDASLVDWYIGPGWIGWAPIGHGHRPPRPHPPGGGAPLRAPQPGPRPHPLSPARQIVAVPTAVVQNRQMITPQMVNHLEPNAENMIEKPPFEPNPRTASVATSPALGAGTKSTSSTTAAAATPAPAKVAGSGMGFASHHASAPSTILMGGNAAAESLLLANHGFHSGHQPLRAIGGTTLGGRYDVNGSPGEFRGHTFMGKGTNDGTARMSGPAGGPNTSHAAGGSVAIAPHGQSGGSARGGSFSRGSAPGGGAVRGGGVSSGGGHSGGGGSV